jgi:hypothetical protein
LCFGSAAYANPGDPSCHDARNALVQAQAVIGDSRHPGTAAGLQEARDKDRAAQARRDAAIAQATKAYDDAVKNAPVDDPKTPGDEHAAALKAAADQRDAAIAAAKDAYDKGGTAAAVDKAGATHRQAEHVLAEVIVVVGRVCKPQPAPEPVPAPVPAPAPVVPPAPAAGPATGDDSMSQIGQAPEGSAETGDGSLAQAS